MPQCALVEALTAVEAEPPDRAPSWRDISRRGGAWWSRLRAAIVAMIATRWRQGCIRLDLRRYPLPIAPACIAVLDLVLPIAERVLLMLAQTAMVLMKR